MPRSTRFGAPIATLAVLLGALPAAGAPAAPARQTVVAGKEYEAGGFTRLWLGADYRKTGGGYRIVDGALSATGAHNHPLGLARRLPAGRARARRDRQGLDRLRARGRERAASAAAADWAALRGRRGDLLSDRYLVGTLACTCNNGWLVVACMPDGNEIVTDAKSTSTQDLRAWVEGVRERTKDLPGVARIFGREMLAEIMPLINFVQRPCVACGKTGVLLTVTAPMACCNRGVA